MAAPPAARACGHPLCALIGGDCSLASGLSRGCRTGHHPERTIAPAVADEVAGLLATLAGAGPDERRAAAVRLAALHRREARDDRNLLLLVEDLEPADGERLTALLRRSR